ncbi:hypothetical protein ACFLUJ_06870 [Chloroflexota bacterium]
MKIQRPRSVKTTVNWETKKLIWLKLAQGETINATLRFLELNTDKYDDIPSSRNTITRAREEIYTLNLSLARKLVEEMPAIESFLLEKRPELKVDLKASDNTAFKSEELANRKRFHDAELFRESDAVLNESELNRILYLLDYGHHIWDRSDAIKLECFADFFRMESKKYINPQIHRSCNSLCRVIDKLLQFFVPNSGPRDPFRSDETEFKLRPEFRHPEYPQYNIPKDGWSRAHEQYEILEETLYELTDGVRKAYSEYRGLIRTNLML